MKLKHRALALTLAVALVAATGCKQTIKNLKANYNVKQGNQLYRAGDHLKAIDFYKKAIRLNPDFPLPYYDTALCYMALYKPGSKHPKDQEYLQGAIDYFKKFLRLEPRNEEAKSFLLTVYLQGERYDDAAVGFEKELKAKQGDPQAASQIMQRLGMIYAKKGEFETSLEWYRKRADLDKNSPEALYTIGVLCWNKVYHQGADLDNDQKSHLIDMGMDYLKRAVSMRQDYFEAVTYINLLYREKAKVAQLMGNPEDVTKYNEEADQNLKLALEMRKRVMAKK
jgi:tetratricopeptide (TPR) repeat protein